MTITIPATFQDAGGFYARIASKSSKVPQVSSGSEGGQIAPTAPAVSASDASDATDPKLFAIAEKAYNDT